MRYEEGRAYLKDVDKDDADYSAQCCHSIADRVQILYEAGLRNIGLLIQILLVSFLTCCFTS